MKRSIRNIIHIFVALGSTLASTLYSDTGNVWHIPTIGQDGVPTTMRDPSFPSSNEYTTFYQGVWKGDGANQVDGGLLIYRVNNTDWQSSPLVFHSNVNDGTDSHNQFWKSSVTTPLNPGDIFDYYFIIEFDNRYTTYLFGNNSNSSLEAVSYTHLTLPTSDLV